MSADKKNEEKDLTTPKSSDTIKLDQSNSSEGSTADPDTSHTRIMSESEALVSDLVKEAPREISELAISRQPGVNVLELPEECKQYANKKFRYRWLANNKFLSAKLRSSIWVLCTRENSPYIKLTRFKSHGAVEQAGMLLAFTTEGLAEKREREPAERSANLVKHYTKDLPNSGNGKAGFYKPESSGEDNEDGLEEGRDFAVPSAK